MAKGSTLKSKHQPITINSWLLMFLLFSIPVFNIFMLIYYGFIQKISRTKQNFARSLVIYSAILVLLFVVFIIVFQIDLTQTWENFKVSISNIPTDEIDIIYPASSYIGE